MRIRQIAFVAEDLEAAAADLCATLDLEVGFRDPGVAEFGLANVVIPVGDTFLEVVSPTKPGTSAGRLLEKRAGDGGYMVILQSEDLDADRKRLHDLSVRIVWEVTLDDIATLHLHPRDVGGAILSLDVADPPSSWRWGGPDWQSHRRTETTEWITGVDIQSDDPAALARRWANIVEYPVVPTSQGEFEIPLNAGCLRFTPLRDGRGEGVSGLEVKVSDKGRILAVARERGLPIDGDSFLACGVRIRLTGIVF